MQAWGTPWVTKRPHNTDLRLISAILLLGGPAAMYAKASIWLLADDAANLCLYSAGAGVIAYDELCVAMDQFLKVHWKYDGHLW